MFCEQNFDEFVSKSTLNFLNILKINCDFLKVEPTCWSGNAKLQQVLALLKNLRVVNDVAERGIKLITEYNNVLSKDELQQQYILQVVNQYRKEFINTNKSTVVST